MIPCSYGIMFFFEIQFLKINEEHLYFQFFLYSDTFLCYNMKMVHFDYKKDYNFIPYFYYKKGDLT